jgi:formate C-acetyltransferase
VECIADGATYPAIVNDEAIIPAMVERGITLEHARDYSFVGCGQTFPHGRGHGNYEDVVINSAKPLELALNDGLDPRAPGAGDGSGKRLGPTTGSPDSFRSWEEFEQAYRRQMDHHITERIEWVNSYRRKLVGRTWDFIRSLLTHSCVERGLDWHAGGADYSEGMVDMVGLTTTTDSLVAIHRAVFEEKLISLPDLVAILNRNWEGAEELRHRLLRKMPKFGNEDPEADDYTATEAARVNDHIKSHKTVFGGPWGMDIIGWSGAVEFGLQTGATPDGRRRAEPLADCAGPAQGRNTRGLTATLNSTLRLPHKHAHGPMVLSLRFPKHVVRGSEGRAKLKAVIETYCRLGGQQLQISIASTDDMKAAQRDPDAWRDLMVRVGGFSAYFIHLDKKFQDDMIARSELEL